MKPNFKSFIGIYVYESTIDNFRAEFNKIKQALTDSSMLGIFNMFQYLKTIFAVMTL